MQFYCHSHKIHFMFSNPFLCKLPLAQIEDESNDIDVEATLEQVKKNDSSLTEINLNNVVNIQTSTLVEFFEALKDLAY